jgi:hypothetical protein
VLAESLRFLPLYLPTSADRKACPEWCVGPCSHDTQTDGLRTVGILFDALGLAQVTFRSLPYYNPIPPDLLAAGPGVLSRKLLVFPILDALSYGGAE